MARISMLDEASATKEQQAYFSDLREWLKPMPGPRANHKLIPQPWRVWGHSPELARWLFEGGQLALTKLEWGLAHIGLRQLAIITVASRLRCAYAIVGHWPLLAKAGLSREQYDVLVDDVDYAKVSPLFDDEQHLVIAYADALASRANAGRGLFEAVVGRWGERGTVELTAICAMYAMYCINLNVADVQDDLPET